MRRDGIVSDEMDMDGHGNWGRFPTEKPKKKRLTKSRKKVKL